MAYTGIKSILENIFKIGSYFKHWLLKFKVIFFLPCKMYHRGQVNDSSPHPLNFYSTTSPTFCLLVCSR